MTTALDSLTRELGAAPPAALAALDQEHVEVLDDALRAAGEHQRVALEAAIESGLSFVPPLLRGVVKRALFG